MREVRRCEDLNITGVWLEDNIKRIIPDTMDANINLNQIKTLSIFKWLKKNGGLVEMEKVNRHKSDLLYNFIDASDFYYNDIEVLNRSRMNVPFRINDESLTMVFVEEAEKSGLYQLKGHRLVGGLRASIYNAMPVEGIHALINFMQDFEKKYL